MPLCSEETLRMGRTSLTLLTSLHIQHIWFLKIQLIMKYAKNSLFLFRLSPPLSRVKHQRGCSNWKKEFKLRHKKLKKDQVQFHRESLDLSTQLQILSKDINFSHQNPNKEWSWRENGNIVKASFRFQFPEYNMKAKKQTPQVSHEIKPF